MRCQRCFYPSPTLYETPQHPHHRLCSGCVYELLGRTPYTHEAVTMKNPSRTRTLQDVAFGEWA